MNYCASNSGHAALNSNPGVTALNITLHLHAGKGSGWDITTTTTTSSSTSKIE